MKSIWDSDLKISIVFLIGMTCSALVAALSLSEWNFSYALDDAYIHMSIVKNFVNHGYWGIDAYSHASASSSPLWILILSPFFAIFGEALFVYIPFALNISFQVASIYLVLQIVSTFSTQNKQYVYMIAMVLVTPFIPLTFGGMEHSLQIFLILLMLKYLLSYIEKEDIYSRNAMLALSPFIVFVRYEDLAFIAAVAISLALFKRKYLLSILLLLSGVLFIVIFGFVSKKYLGLDYIPSSILAKSALGKEFHLIQFIKLLAFKFLNNMWLPHIFLLYIINVLILYKTYLQDKALNYLVVIFLVTTMFHAAFGAFGWLYRYEAYLVVFGLMNIMIFSLKYDQVNSKMLVLGLLLLAFVKPLFGGLYQSVFGSKNIYEQQVQMGRFVEEFYQGQSIAANDIGAISYFGDIKLLDIFGLGSMEMIELKRHGNHNTKNVNAIMDRRKVEFMMIYDPWFDYLSFPNYVKIGEWTVGHNVILGGTTVSFYSRKDLVKENKIKLDKFSMQSLTKKAVYKRID